MIKKQAIRIIRKILEKRGYEIKLYPKTEEKDCYEYVTTEANYAPWKKDAAFQEALSIVQPHTMIDKYQLWGLWDLVSQTKSLSGILLDVGCWKGGTSGIIAKSAELSGIISRTYSFDTFKGLVDVKEVDTGFSMGDYGDASKEDVLGLCEQLGIKNFCVLPGVFPRETGSFIENDDIRFCHIDVNTYESTKNVFEYVWKNVVPGGLVVFDDYGFEQCVGARDYIDEVKEMDDVFYVHNLNGHMIFMKKSKLSSFGGVSNA